MKKLITYFSTAGTTKERAEQLASVTGGDVKEIKPAKVYSRADLDWTDPNSRCSREHDDASARPALADGKMDLSGYDVVYIGFPIWWGEAPRVINTFIESNDFTGKKVALFATSAETGIDQAEAKLKETYPKLDIVAAKLLNSTVKKDFVG